jgi:signal recognition particle GTPase
MSSLSEDWEKNGNSPEEYLAKYQQEDGGVLVDSETLKNRIWATSYAIPAALEMSWDDILNSVSKPNNKKISVGGSNNTVVTATSTSTLEIAREIEEVEIMEDVATSTITSFVQKFTPQAPVILKKKEEIQEISIQTTQELPIKENQLASVGQIPWFKAWWMYVVGGVLALGFGFKFVPKKTFTK